MAAAAGVISLSYPKNRNTQEKFISIVRTDTTAFIGAWLPKSAVITGIYVIGAAASDAATTATIGIGSTVASNQFMTGFDVKTAATGEGYVPSGAAAVGSALATPLTADTPIYGIYAETGTASTVGGPWVVKVEYFLTGPGETL